MNRVLITGAGRGIGLELARQYAERGDRVLAGCRDIGRAPGLRALVDRHRDRVFVISLDVRARQKTKQVGDRPVSYTGRHE
jgi:NAD(P)-dependent dehydrogenase (short-subunit alcohol dehydrogenase family)